MSASSIHRDMDFVDDDARREAACAVLTSLIQTESGSLVRYLMSQKPYTDRRTLSIRREVERLAGVCSGHEDAIVDHLLELEGHPPTTSHFRDGQYVNYVGWGRLLPDLVRDLKRRIDIFDVGLERWNAIDAADQWGVRRTLEAIQEEHAEELVAFTRLAEQHA
jgi:bacterioferritin (cytochrome b1)